MARETYYKIGVLILALSAITWMFLSNSWGAESKEKRSRENLADRIKEKKFDCSRCHGFMRPERGLR